MKRIPYLISLLILLIVSACHTKTDTQEAISYTQTTDQTMKLGSVVDLEKQVLATHDSVMPYMGEMMRLEKAVQTKIDTTTDAATKERGRTISRQLSEADQLMMAWMHTYKGDTLNRLTEAQAMSYLKEQQQTINDVRDRLRDALKNATLFMK